MTPQPPPGQGPIDPRGAFTPPPPPGALSGATVGSGTGSTPPPSFGGPGNPMMPPPGMYPPGPMFPPPMMMPPPGFFRPQRSFARAIFTTLATAILGLSITLNVYLLAFSNIGGVFGGGGQGITETVLVDGALDEKVVVIPISGVIMRPAADRFDQMLTAAEKDHNV